jgi:hypothetical protein
LFIDELEECRINRENETLLSFESGRDSKRKDRPTEGYWKINLLVAKKL